MARHAPRFPEPDSEPFWEATKNHKLTYQVDRDTGDVVFPPRSHNPRNGSPNLEWRESKGEGEVYTFSVVRLNRDPAFVDLGAYAVAYVDLDEGFRMLTNITGVSDPSTEVQIGQRVKVQWDDHESGYAIPLFAPA